MIDVNKILYAEEAPYPQVQVSEKNPLYGRAMLDNLGGSNSEISAISLYIYNNMIAEQLKDISYIFHKVSVVEMHHLEIFGKLAFMSGENPRLWTHGKRQMIYWTPGYNNYPTELCPLLQNAIQGEAAAIAKYESQLTWIKDPFICENLKRIIMDEKLHLKIFETMYQEQINK